MDKKAPEMAINSHICINATAWPICKILFTKGKNKEIRMNLTNLRQFPFFINWNTAI